MSSFENCAYKQCSYVWRMFGSVNMMKVQVILSLSYDCLHYICLWFLLTNIWQDLFWVNRSWLFCQLEPPTTVGRVSQDFLPHPFPSSLCPSFPATWWLVWLSLFAPPRCLCVAMAITQMPKLKANAKRWRSSWKVWIESHRIEEKSRNWKTQ